MHKCKLSGNGSGSENVQSLNFDFKLKFIKSFTTGDYPKSLNSSVSYTYNH